MEYAHIDRSIYRKIARQIRSGRHEIIFDDPVVSDIDPGLQVLILGTVYVDEAAPADPSLGSSAQGSAAFVTVSPTRVSPISLIEAAIYPTSPDQRTEGCKSS